MIRTFAATVVLALGLVLAAPVHAQQPKASELRSEVAALTAMHEVISPMWHDAWPKKDVAALAGMSSAIQKHASAVKKATLPGILRDKASTWEDGVTRLVATAAAYKAAADAGDEAGLLKAAEALHTDYERLVRVVRPVLKEMEAFHAALYVLYHYQLEPLDVARASATIREMKPLVEALNAATLPERRKAKESAFLTARTRLSTAFDRLLALVESGESGRLREGIELLHLEYEKLEQVF